MFDKYRRSNFMPVDGVISLEKDLILNNWDLFKLKRPISFDTIQRIDVQRPDIFSLRIYGNMSYWWILSKFNQIDDWFSVEIGRDVMIPDIQDIEDFYLAFKARVRK